MCLSTCSAAKRHAIIALAYSPHTVTTKTHLVTPATGQANKCRQETLSCCERAKSLIGTAASPPTRLAALNTLDVEMTTFQAIAPKLITQGRQVSGKRHHAKDRAVIHAVTLCLRFSPYRALRSVRFDLRSGRICLVGIVPTYFMKQMAQETVRRVDGVKVIVNRIVVRDSA